MFGPVASLQEGCGFQTNVVSACSAWAEVWALKVKVGLSIPS